jgi:CDP-paratose 2-epimerase
MIKVKYKRVLIPGGAGFVGSNLAIKLKNNYPKLDVVSFDNLYRKGSELNLPRLKENGVVFIKGDVRSYEDISKVADPDLIIECCAECSVLSGYGESARYMIETNLSGAINCLELAKENKADFIFLSTSRVYPIENLCGLSLEEKDSRLQLASEQPIFEIKNSGIGEEFPLEGTRSFYGASKLSAELMVREYIEGYGIKGVINRCGVIAGPWQMGKVDQGFLSLWVARHIYKNTLTYMGFNGKQVRDLIHIDDLYDLIDMQMRDIASYNAQVYNIGGGIDNSVSLQELTKICQEVTGESILINVDPKKRQVDIPYYVTDYSKINKKNGFKPKRTIKNIVEDVALWINDNKEMLEPIFC